MPSSDWEYHHFVRSKRSLGAILGVVVVAASISTTVLIARPFSSSQDVTKSNDTIALLAESGISTTAADVSEARVSAETVTGAVLAHWPEGAATLDVQLVRATSGGEFNDRLAWAISLDPETLPLALHGGPPGANLQPDKYDYSITLVDALTGSELTTVAANHFFDCDRETCPPTPSPFS